MNEEEEAPVPASVVDMAGMLVNDLVDESECLPPHPSANRPSAFRQEHCDVTGS
jgi:hypothetical protein